MANFDLYAPILKRLEGGYVNNPADQGGPTMAGVTLASFRAVFGKNKTVKDLKNMTDAQWKQIMKVYWNACRGDDINNQAIANIVVDWNVNSGAAGRKAVQTALKLYSDGIFGPKTLNALNAEPQRCVFCKIKAAREEFYNNIVRKTPSQIVFLRGWLNRLKMFEYDEG